MKQVILIMALLGSVTIGAKSQTNRTYYTGMQTQQIREDERRGGTPSNNQVRLSLGTETSAQEELSPANSASMQMNTMQEHQGYRMNSMQQYYGGSTGPVEMLNNVQGYDTSRNNGHCFGCGSGAVTDHRRWLISR